MNIKLLGDRVIVRHLGYEEEDKSGFKILETEMEKPLKGLVLKVGPGINGLPMTVQEGDTVLYGKNAGIKIDEHAGSNFGTSVVCIVPEIDLGVAVFTNANFKRFESDRMVSAIKLKVIEKYLNINEKDWNSIFLKVNKELLNR